MFQLKNKNNHLEKKHRKQILGDFDPKECEAWAKLTAKYGNKITHNKLLSLAEIASFHLGIALFREYKRNKEMLIMWYDKNLDVVWPFLEAHIMVVDNQGTEY